MYDIGLFQALWVAGHISLTKFFNKVFVLLVHTFPKERVKPELCLHHFEWTYM